MKPIGCEGIRAETIENPAGSDLVEKQQQDKRASEALMEKEAFSGCHR